MRQKGIYIHPPYLDNDKEVLAWIHGEFADIKVKLFRSAYILRNLLFANDHLAIVLLHLRPSARPAADPRAITLHVRLVLPFA